MCRLLTQSFWNSRSLNNTKNLHQSIGDFLSDQIKQWNNKNNKQLTIILDKACGGSQNIQLFLSSKKTSFYRVCKVDILILVNNEIKFIIEIDESNIKPVNILGKFFASAIADCYIDKNNIYSKSNQVCFIQIISAKSLKKNSNNSKKPKQFQNIKKKVNELLQNSNCQLGNIIKYKIFIV
ncbi:MAG: hypothetical protein N2449_10400 [Bacteroidales bacterium]|nr:hypothetical protein [Bacteroidales bacterium]